MNRKQITLLVVALALIGGTAFGMKHLQSAQRLGAPGVRTTPIPGSARLNIDLPPKVLDYEGTSLPIDTNFFLYMPPDTSYTQFAYFPEGTGDSNRVLTQFERALTNITLNAVLMGIDRTSIHKPEFCLTGQGWNINPQDSRLDKVRVGGAKPYDLEVMRLMTSREFPYEGGSLRLTGIYIYWFVADNDLTASHSQRMWRSAVRLLKTGELERWAYVGFFGICLPGQEEAKIGQMKKFISAAVPEFQRASNSR